MPLVFARFLGGQRRVTYIVNVFASDLSRSALAPVTVFHIWKTEANALRLIKTWRCPVSG